MIDSDIAAAVAFAELHIEKCGVDQPQMRVELEAAHAAWKQRNLKHVRDAKGRADYQEIVHLVRPMIVAQGIYDVEHCRQVILFSQSEEHDIDTKIRTEEAARSNAHESWPLAKGDGICQ
ncbi:MAG: hypothetical protein V4757_13940 [Pseudomonadota bacterium]